jgi:quinol monooxygenase YgiN
MSLADRELSTRATTSRGAQHTEPPEKDTESMKTVPMVRIANLIVDEVHLESYKAALKEEIEASVRLEAGVLTLYAVSAKDDPAYFTILEIYADQASYEAHLKTPHFVKYKTSTQEMVKSLKLAESEPLAPEMKIK